MTAGELTSLNEMLLFTIGKSKIQWECAAYPDRSDANKVRITRMVQPEEGGKTLMLGMNYKERYVDPDTVVNIIDQE